VTKVTITIDDAGGKVAVGCEIPGGYNPNSLACNMANAIINFLDAHGQREEAPEMVHVARDYPGKHARLTLIKPEQSVIHAG